MGRNQSDRNLRNETEAQLADLADEQAGLNLDEADLEPGSDIGMNQTGTAAAGGTAMRTRATPKTAAQQAASAQQSNSMRDKRGNQPTER